MSIIRFNEECGYRIDVKVKKDLTIQEAQSINEFFNEFKEDIMDYDTNEEFIDAGMKKLSRKMKFKYEIMAGPDFEISI